MDIDSTGQQDKINDIYDSNFLQECIAYLINVINNVVAPNVHHAMTTVRSAAADAIALLIPTILRSPREDFAAQPNFPALQEAAQKLLDTCLSKFSKLEGVLGELVEKQRAVVDSDEVGQFAREIEREMGVLVQLAYKWLEFRMGQVMEGELAQLLPGLLLLQVS